MEEAENYAWEHVPELSLNERSTNGSATQTLVKSSNRQISDDDISNCRRQTGEQYGPTGISEWRQPRPSTAHNNRAHAQRKPTNKVTRLVTWAES